MINLAAVNGDYWTAGVITAWLAGLAGILTVIVALYKAWSTHKSGQDDSKLTLAAAQLQYLVKPMREELDAYKLRTAALEKGTAAQKIEIEALQKECSSLRENNKTTIIYARFLGKLFEWIDENIEDRKTEMPDVPYEVSKHMEDHMIKNKQTDGDLQ